MSKTPEYTRRAIERYNAKFDKVAVNLPKGTRDRITAQGLTVNGFINNLVLAELDRLEQDNRTRPEAPTTATDEQPEAADAAPDEQEQEKAPARAETPEEEAARLADLQAILEDKKATQAHREEEQRQRKEAEEKRKAAHYRRILTERIEEIKASREAAAEDDQSADDRDKILSR